MGLTSRDPGVQSCGPLVAEEGPYVDYSMVYYSMLDYSMVYHSMLDYSMVYYSMLDYSMVYYRMVEYSIEYKHKDPTNPPGLWYPAFTGP